MMAESGDDANHESTFEIIHAQQDTPVPAPEFIPPAPPGSIPVPEIPPPSALPSFAALRSPTAAAHGLAGPPVNPAPPPIPLESAGLSRGGSNPFSIRAAAASQPAMAAPPVPPSMGNVMMPTPTITAAPEAPANPTFVTGPQPPTGVEIAFDISTHGSSAQPVGDPYAQHGVANASGVWGWVRGAVSNSPLLSKVAETAKSSVDTVIATLDPQMKDYMNNQGLLDIVVTLDREEEIRGVKDGFMRIFPAANIRPFVVAASLHVAAQTVGFNNAIQAAQQKVSYVRSSGYVDQCSLIIGSEGCLIEVESDTWLYFDCLLLDDSARQVQVHAFTQPVQVPREIVQLLKDQTQADYPFKNLGYALPVSHAMTHSWSLGPLEWQERLCGTSRRDLLKAAASALAYSYRIKF